MSVPGWPASNHKTTHVVFIRSCCICLRTVKTESTLSQNLSFEHIGCSRKKQKFCLTFNVTSPGVVMFSVWMLRYVQRLDVFFV